MDSRFAGFREGQELTNELADELVELMKAKGAFSQPKFRRILVRSLFALVESFISRLKGRVEERQDRLSANISPKVLAIVNEGHALIRDDGSVAWEAIRPGTRKHVTATMRAYADVHGKSTPMGGTLALPREFQVAVRARNRVVHPKKLSDLSISDEELVATGTVVKWLVDATQWTTDTEIENIERVREETRQSIGAQLEEIRRGDPHNCDDD